MIGKEDFDLRDREGRGYLKEGCCDGGSREKAGKGLEVPLKDKDDCDLGQIHPYLFLT